MSRRASPAKPRPSGSDVEPGDAEAARREQTADACVANTSAGLRGRRRLLAAALVDGRGAEHAQAPAERAWSTLLDGAWRLVDHFERDGRTYLLARRSHVRSEAREVLTPAETVCAIYVGMGHSQKVIAAELGVSESTTSTHVRRAMRKLGLTSRADLARVFGAGRSE